MGSKTMTGGIDTLFEDTELAEFSGYIFLNGMQAGDSITLRVEIMDVNDSTYRKWLEDTYAGVQSCPALRMEAIIGKVGIKVTAQQTAGTYRTLTYQWFKR
jgi:hypothetical protein